MPHDFDPAHPHSALPPDPVLRVQVLETILTQKGLIDPDTLAAIIATYENDIGPQNGARLVAKAWCDQKFRAALLDDLMPLLCDLGYYGRQGEHMVILENTESRHHMVVCTLCSCYPWPLLGIPPAWYKSDAYRARAVREPRQVLAEFGMSFSDSTSIRVWDSMAEIRYLVLPQRPPDTAQLSEDYLCDWVSRDSMIGTGLARAPK